MSKTRAITIHGRHYSSWNMYVRSLRGRFAGLPYKKKLRALHHKHNTITIVQRTQIKTEKKIIGSGFTQTTNELEKVKTIRPVQTGKEKIELQTSVQTYRINTVAHEDPETGSIWSTEIEEASRYTPGELHYEYEDLGGGIIQIKGIKNGRIVTSTITNDIPSVSKEVEKKTLQDQFEDWQEGKGKRLTTAELQVLGKELNVDVGGGKLKHPRATFENRIAKKLADLQQKSRSTAKTEEVYQAEQKRYREETRKKQEVEARKKLIPVTKSKAPKYSNEEEINAIINKVYSDQKTGTVRYERPDIDQMELLLFKNASKNRPDRNYNAEQLQKGIKVELEHTKSKEIAKIIAKDHLDESSDYYKGLTKLEKQLEKK